MKVVEWSPCGISCRKKVPMQTVFSCVEPKNSRVIWGYKIGVTNNAGLANIYWSCTLFNQVRSIRIQLFWRGILINQPAFRWMGSCTVALFFFQNSCRCGRWNGANMPYMDAMGYLVKLGLDVRWQIYGQKTNLSTYANLFQPFRGSKFYTDIWYMTLAGRFETWSEPNRSKLFEAFRGNHHYCNSWINHGETNTSNLWL